MRAFPQRCGHTERHGHGPQRQRLVGTRESQTLDLDKLMTLPLLSQLLQIGPVHDLGDHEIEMEASLAHVAVNVCDAAPLIWRSPCSKRHVSYRLRSQPKARCLGLYRERKSKIGKPGSLDVEKRVTSVRRQRLPNLHTE
eukprot:CAMPEP_0194528516 /NCGR_PEP_ID=MMETSP0253-20130528/64928_1 /TAXON_ID=2966 /ORGANISM="Noctiluca scintillans" /LENGTH=139 /DNA_ID=CAMNT_0039373567 /DNA_START=319 /DNA_END=738 /DNA_ORIENTATION=-